MNDRGVKLRGEGCVGGGIKLKEGEDAGFYVFYDGWEEELVVCAKG